MQKVRDDLDFEFPISFSAGVDARNFPSAVACGMVPITTCTDLLRQGGYGRLPGYLKSLRREMDRVGVKSRDAFVLAAGGNAADAVGRAFTNLGAAAGASQLGRVAAANRVDPDSLSGLVRESAQQASLNGDRALLEATRVAGRLNSREIGAALESDERYRARKNAREPRTVDSKLGLYDCLNCDLCIVVCPNDAFFSYEVEPEESVSERHQLAFVDESCNECSNCEVFCPEEGAPFKVKERVFQTEDNYAASTDDGFFLDGNVLRARIAGEEHRFGLSGADGPGSLTGDIAARASRVKRAIFEGPTPNPVNPAGGGAE
jgi:putative selenate reductase